MSRITFILLLLLTLTFAVRAQQRPLITEDVDIIPPGTIRIEAGIDFMQGAKYPVSGITGDLTRVGVIGISFGMGPNVEFQIEGVAQNYLSINSSGPSAIPLQIAPGVNSTNDTGDFTIAAKFKLRNETRRGPSLGFRFGVQLPNSSQGTGIGLNQTNAFVWFSPIPRASFEFGSCTPKRNPNDGPRLVSLRSLNLAARVKSPVSFVELAPGKSSSGMADTARELMLT